MLHQDENISKDFKKIGMYAKIECHCRDFITNGWCIGCGALYRAVKEYKTPKDQSLTIIFLKNGNFKLAVNPLLMHNIGELAGLQPPNNIKALRNYMVRLALTAQSAMLMISGMDVILYTNDVDVGEIYRGAIRIIDRGSIDSSSQLKYKNNLNQNIVGKRIKETTPKIMELNTKKEESGNNSIAENCSNLVIPKHSMHNTKSEFSNNKKYYTLMAMQSLTISGVNAQICEYPMACVDLVGPYDIPSLTSTAGIGVRIGIYAAVIATLLESVNRPEEVPSAVASSILLIGSAMIIMYVDIPIHEVDAPSLYVLLELAILVLLTHSFIYNINLLAARRIVIIDWLMNILIVATAIWFVAGGGILSNWIKFFGFLFSKQVFSEWLCIVITVLVFINLFWLLYRAFRILPISFGANRIMHTVEGQKNAIIINKIIARRWTTISLTIVTIIIAVVSSELIIKWNHLSYLNEWDGGQVIAVMVGAFPLIRATVAIIKSIKERKWSINRDEVYEAYTYMSSQLPGICRYIHKNDMIRTNTQNIIAQQVGNEEFNQNAINDNAEINNDNQTSNIEQDVEDNINNLRLLMNGIDNTLNEIIG